MAPKQPTVGKLETLGQPWFNVEEGLRWLRETGALEPFQTSSPTLGQPRRQAFHQYCERQICGGAPESSKSPSIALLYRPDLKVGTRVTELGNLNVMRLIGSWGALAKWQHPTTKVMVVWLSQRMEESKQLTE